MTTTQLITTIRFWEQSGHFDLNLYERILSAKENGERDRKLFSSRQQHTFSRQDKELMFTNNQQAIRLF